MSITARYWRLRFASAVNSNNVCAAEVEFHSTVGGADITGSGTASDNGNIGGGYVAAKAFDNDPATMWNASVTGNSILAYDFGSAVAVAEYSIKTRNDGFLGDSPSSWRLEYSSDNAAWKIADAVGRQAAWSLGETRAFQVEGQNALPQYWRLNATTTVGGSNISIAELGLRESVGGSSYATVDSGVASSGGTLNPTFPPSNAVDQNASTIWNVAAATWLGFDTGVGRNVRQYTITARSDGFTGDNPKDFTLQYSFDGSTWVTVDTRTAQTGWTAGETRTYTVASPYMPPSTGGKRRPRPWQTGSKRGNSYKRP